MLTKQELPALIELLSDQTRTFEQCLHLFLKFSKGDQQFRACSSLCYLLENNVSIAMTYNLLTVNIKELANNSVLHPLRALPE